MELARCGRWKWMSGWCVCVCVLDGMVAEEDTGIVSLGATS